MARSRKRNLAGFLGELLRRKNDVRGSSAMLKRMRHIPTVRRGIDLNISRVELETPAFVYDERIIDRSLRFADRLRIAGNCSVLFAVKSFSFIDVLRLMGTRLDGFAVSSLFEARLAHEALDGKGSVHLTTPGIRPAELDDIASLCDYVTFNSLSQWDKYHDRVSPNARCGLRVNPKMSFIRDDRYDPCRPHSKLGVPIQDVVSTVTHEPDRLMGLQGIHIHSNCDSMDLRELRATVQHLQDQLGGLLKRVDWINLGGGYVFDFPESLEVMSEIVGSLESRFGLQVFLEPGAAFCREAGYIVSTVLDVFESDGKTIAVLDTTVNHMSEVFEYGFEPDVLGHDENSPHEYLLAGCTCLAGDLFGAYRFQAPLDVGSRVVFCNAGAYTLSKAHMFNGINLPSIYALTQAGELVLQKRFTYADFAGRWGSDGHGPS